RDRRAKLRRFSPSSPPRLRLQSAPSRSSGSGGRASPRRSSRVRYPRNLVRCRQAEGNRSHRLHVRPRRRRRRTKSARTLLSARFAGVEGRVTPQFETTFAVRTYSIALSAEATQTSEAVSMPPPTTVSYDPSFGSERVAEKARVLASEISDKLRAFLSKQR